MQFIQNVSKLSKTSKKTLYLDKCFEDSLKELNNLIGELDSFQKEIDASKDQAQRPLPAAERASLNVGEEVMTIITDNQNRTMTTIISDAETNSSTMDQLMPSMMIVSTSKENNPSLNQDSDEPDYPFDVRHNESTRQSITSSFGPGKLIPEMPAQGKGGQWHHTSDHSFYDSDLELSRCCVSETSSLLGNTAGETGFTGSLISGIGCSGDGYENPTFVHLSASSTASLQHFSSYKESRNSDNGRGSGSGVVVIYDHQPPITPDIDYVKQNSEIVILRPKPSRNPFQMTHEQQTSASDLQQLLPNALSSSVGNDFADSSPTQQRQHLATVLPAKQRLSSFRTSYEQQQTVAISAISQQQQSISINTVERSGIDSMATIGGHHKGTVPLSNNHTTVQTRTQIDDDEFCDSNASSKESITEQQQQQPANQQQQNQPQQHLVTSYCTDTIIKPKLSNANNGTNAQFPVFNTNVGGLMVAHKNNSNNSNSNNNTSNSNNSNCNKTGEFDNKSNRSTSLETLPKFVDFRTDLETMLLKQKQKLLLHEQQQLQQQQQKQPLAATSPPTLSRSTTQNCNSSNIFTPSSSSRSSQTTASPASSVSAAFSSSSSLTSSSSLSSPTSSLSSPTPSTCLNSNTIYPSINSNTILGNSNRKIPLNVSNSNNNNNNNINLNMHNNDNKQCSSFMIEDPSSSNGSPRLSHHLSLVPSNNNKIIVDGNLSGAPSQLPVLINCSKINGIKQQQSSIKRNLQGRSSRGTATISSGYNHVQNGNGGEMSGGVKPPPVPPPMPPPASTKPLVTAANAKSASPATKKLPSVINRNQSNRALVKPNITPRPASLTGLLALPFHFRLRDSMHCR